LIDGAWKEASSKNVVNVYNPANGEIIAQVPDCGKDETLQAIEAAKNAFPSWSSKTPAERCALVRKFHDLVVKNTDSLAALLTSECGKPFDESKGEIAYSASFLDWFSEEGKRMYGDIIPPPRGDRRMITLKQPIGVCALLAPWNFSSAMVARKLAPALVAGCTMVVRPSIETPLSALALGQLALEAGIPAGVINIVTGVSHDEIAKTLTTHPDVAKVSFTGSTRVGRMIM
jgi:succinate-semialdehyde dehydrogenase/glutarate-semialdehyde dehydrogenase